MKEGGKPSYQLMEPAGEEDLQQEDMWEDNAGLRGKWRLVRRKVRGTWEFIRKGLHMRWWRYVMLFVLFIVYMAGYATYLAIFTQNQSNFHLNVLASSDALSKNGNDTAPWVGMSMAAIDVTQGTLRLNVRVRVWTCLFFSCCSLINPSFMILGVLQGSS